MATSPHIELRKALGQEDGWSPGWARRLKQVDAHFEASPPMIYSNELQELGELSAQGHGITIDVQRLGATRIRIAPRTF